MCLSDFDAPAITILLKELKIEATAFVRSCDAQAEIQAQYKVYMRYSGQGWEIPVQLTATQAETPDLATFQALFEREYAALFGRVVEAMDVEITVWSVNATTPAQSVTPVDVISRLPLMTTQIRRALFDPATAAVALSSEVLRSDMTPGTCIAGPAVITEDETTIIVPTSRRATALADGCIDVSDKGADL